ncbi:hypothetical protein KPC142_01313 [Klebsiella quasipneumoniae]|nr:hypothetical protein KPC142_01313 [Klebsiella quasipneumoniae]
MTMINDESVPNVQEIEEAINQVRHHLSEYNCSIKTDDYGSVIFIRFPESESHNPFNFTIDSKIFKRKIRLKEHLEFIERQLKENGRI